MEFKLFHCLLLLIILLLLSATGHAKRGIPNYKKTTSPFEFINHLKGCHKGNHTNEIHLLKNYLHEFGYLHLNHNHSNDDDFDDALEAAVKTYQHNFHVKPTGIIDDDTVSKMTTPRCGVPDIVNGTNYMQSRKKENSSSSSVFHIVSHFSFFPGNPRWPASKRHLTYGFLPNTPSSATSPVVRAFSKWDSVTHFTFSQAQNHLSADLVIGFHRGNHGDGEPFDGPGGTLAHAFAPTNGRLHFDADETWSNGPIPNTFDLETVAIHEIGHLLGLRHSSVEDAIMFPTIASGTIKNLHADDINGIRALYNV